jgi:hypothetical protein
MPSAIASSIEVAARSACFGTIRDYHKDVDIRTPSVLEYGVEMRTPGGSVGHPLAPARPSAPPADVHEAVTRWLSQYTPRRMVPSDLWESSLRLFVTSAVLDIRPSGLQVAQSATWALTRLAAWGLEEGLSLDRDVLLDPDTVERFAAALSEIGVSPSTQQLARTHLRRMGRQLTSTAPWEPAPRSYGTHALAPPYSEQELAALVHDARAQATPQRRRGARAVIALGAGAGLDGRWVMRVRGTDIMKTPEAVLVRTGSPAARIVPLIAEYEDELQELAGIAGGETLVGAGATRSAGHFVFSLEVGSGNPKLSPSRLRTTWLVRHLSAGTRLPELTRAAGVSWLSHPDELFALVPPLPDEMARSMLRHPARSTSAAQPGPAESEG